MQGFLGREVNRKSHQLPRVIVRLPLGLYTLDQGSLTSSGARNARRARDDGHPRPCASVLGTGSLFDRPLYYDATPNFAGGMDVLKTVMVRTEQEASIYGNAMLAAAQDAEQDITEETVKGLPCQPGVVGW
ncbi:unnamed protein product [Fusarium graminearum]|nr:unnamed protein product [Fusarium graminearum]